MANELMTQAEAPLYAPADEGAESVSSLVRLAIERGVDVELLERVVALQERVTERNAEMAMAEALAGFQAECPSIAKTKTADVRKDGRKLYEYQFSPLDEIARVIRPHLAKYGLSYTHDGEVTDRSVKTVCTLQHVEGATRTATFVGPIDTSGGKNPIQQVASARSYGRRYSLIDVLGLTTGDDDDGHGAGGGEPEPEKISSQHADAIDSLLTITKSDRQKFFAWLGVECIADMTEDDYKRAVPALEQKKGRAA